MNGRSGIPSNKRRLSDALDLYRSAMRSFIASKMMSVVGPDWFLDRVLRGGSVSVRRADYFEQIVDREHGIRTTGRSEHGRERLLEIKDFAPVIRRNYDVFRDFDVRRDSHRLAGYGGNPITLMHEILDWRNVEAHPPSNDLEARDVDRVLEAIERVLDVCHDPVVARIRELRADSRPGKARVTVSQIRKKTEAAASEEREAAKKIRDDAQRELKQAEKIRNVARRDLEAAQQTHDQVRAEREQAESSRSEALNAVQEAKRKEILWREREAKARQAYERLRRAEEAGGSVSGRDHAPAATRAALERYRGTYGRAGSGNGYTCVIPVDDGWTATCWVGVRHGGHRACVFAPSRLSEDGKLITTPFGALLEHICDSEDDGFRRLFHDVRSGRVEQLALDAIKRFEGKDPTQDSVDEFDDDIPF